MSMYFLLVDQMSSMTHNLQMLSYYMESVEQGRAATGHSRPQYGLEDCEEFSTEE